MGGLLDSRWAFRLRKPKHRRCREILHEELSHILVLALQTSLYYAPIAFDGANIVTDLSVCLFFAKLWKNYTESKSLRQLVQQDEMVK